MQKSFRFLILFVVAFVFMASTFDVLAQEDQIQETENLEIIVPATPPEITLTKNLDTITLNFDVSSLEENYKVTEVRLKLNQKEDASSAAILKLIDPKTKYILAAVSSAQKGEKEFQGLKTIFESRIDKNSANFTIEIDDLGDDMFINFDNIRLQIIYEYKDETPPQLLKVESQEVESDSALIVWETNEQSKGKIRYGKTSNYSFTVENENEEIIVDEEDPEIITYRYSTLLLNLSQGLTYHYQVVIEDMEGNVYESKDQIFTTPLQNAPVLGTESRGSTLKKVSDFLGELFFESGKYKFEIYWADSPDLNIEGYLIYRQEKEGELRQYAKVSAEESSFIDEFVEEGKEYTYFVRAYKANFVSPKSDQLTVLIVPENVSASDSQNLLSLDIKKITLFVAGVTMAVLLIGYFAIKSTRSFYRQVFVIEKRKNLFRDPDFFEKEFDSKGEE